MMKKLQKVVLLALLVLLTLSLPALAAGEQTKTTDEQSKTQVDVYEGTNLVKSVVFVVGLNRYFINGQTPGVEMDVAPYIDQNRTFVPVRYLGYALGVKENDVNWDNALQKASLTLPPNTVEMAIGEKRIITNGQAKDIDVSPELKQDRTFLPARYVAEGLGYTVKWVNKDGKDYVICWPQNEPEPDISAVKEYVNNLPVQNPPQLSTPPGVKPMDKIEVTSQADLEGINPVYVRPWPNGNIKLYKGYVKASDLPVQVDGKTIYNIGLKDGKFEVQGYTLYEGKIITLTTDSQWIDMLIIDKDGRVRERQLGNAHQLPDGKWELEYELQHTAETSNGIPPVDLKNVKYFVVNTAADFNDGEYGLLFIENPFNS